MAEVKQNLSNAQTPTETPRGGGETTIKDASKTATLSEGRTVTINESQVEEVPPEVGDLAVEIDRRKLRPVEGRAPTPIPSEEEWNDMQIKIQHLASTSGDSEQKEQKQKQANSVQSSRVVSQVDRKISGEKLKSD